MLLRELFKEKENSLQEFDLGSVWTGIKTLGRGLLSAPAAAAQLALTPSSTAKYDTMDAASSVYQGALNKGMSGPEAEKLAQDFEKSLKANPNDPKVKQIHSQYAAWDDNFNEIPGSTKVAKTATDIKPDLVVKPKISTAPVDDPTTKIPQISKSEKPIDPKDFEKAIAGNDVKKVSDAIPNVVANTAAADALSKKTFNNPTEIEQGIKSAVGNNMPSSSISALAATAAKYAIPAAGIAALLYGGKKLYDYLTKEESVQSEAGHPDDLGSMNDKMRDALSKVYSADEKEKQDKIDAENKSRDDAKKAATMYAVQHPEEMENYIRKLKSHDWTYEYSDDHSVWRRGADAHKELRQMADKMDPEHEIWNKYDPFAKKEEAYTPTKDKEDYFAKKKALQDLEMNPSLQDPESKEAIKKRKAALDKDTKEHLDLLDIIKLAGMEESATAGATSSANIATVANPHLSPGQARGKKSYTGSPWGGKSGTKSPPQPSVKQPKKSDGTAKNALDMKNNIFGENPIRR